MTERDNTKIEERFLDVLTGREDLDVTGQFLDKEQLMILEDAELLRNAILSIEAKEKASASEIDIEKSTNKFIQKLKQRNIL